MYEYLSAGSVRRTFTDSNLSLINTDADRFMKVDPPSGVAPGEPGVWTGNPVVAGISAQQSLNNSLPPQYLPTSGSWAVPVLTENPLAPSGAQPAAAVLADGPLAGAPVSASGGEVDQVYLAGGSRDVLIGGLGNDLLLGGFGQQTPASQPAAAGSAGASPSQAQAVSDGFWADHSFRAGQTLDWHYGAEQGSGTSTTDLVMSLAGNGDLVLTVQPACAAAWLGDAASDA
jgi:hypothetical protein